MRDVFVRRLAQLRKRAGLTKAELARRVGVDRSLVSNWESGRHRPSIDLLPGLARTLETTIDYLLGNARTSSVAGSAEERTALGMLKRARRTLSDAVTLLDDSEKLVASQTGSEEGRRLPVVGAVPAGTPDAVAEHWDGFTLVPNDWLRAADEGFVLRITGDSMSPTLETGDLVVVRRQATADPGDIVVAVVGGQVTVKRLARGGNGLVLKPDAISYESVAVGEDTRINGTVVGFMRRLKRRGRAR